jgi:L-alanine-DL-glutamate epimerase-like enolase superfamily enzyme
MKITDVTAMSLSRMHGLDEQWKTMNFNSIKADASIVTIHTDEGIVGIAEPSPYGVPTVIADIIATKIQPELIGKDPLEALSIGFHPNGLSLSYDCAIAGIDAALWDIRGKVEGKRVADLLRPDGKALTSVRLYASGGCNFDWRANPESLIEEVVGYQQQGFTASKIRVGTEWGWDDVTPKRTLELYREVRNAVGDAFELMCDGNWRLTEDEALELGRGLDELHFTWFEEPIHPSNLQGYVRLNEALDLPVTGGESITTLEQFYPYIESGAYAIAQPDVGISGITESWRIVEAATRHGIEVCPHSWHNGLLAMMNANLVAAMPHPHVLELCRIQGPLQWSILADPPDISNGHLQFGDGHGFGVNVAEGLETRYPYVEGDWRITIDREDVAPHGAR